MTTNRCVHPTPHSTLCSPFASRPPSAPGSPAVSSRMRTPGSPFTAGPSRMHKPANARVHSEPQRPPSRGQRPRSPTNQPPVRPVRVQRKAPPQAPAPEPLPARIDWRQYRALQLAQSSKQHAPALPVEVHRPRRRVLSSGSSASINTSPRCVNAQHLQHPLWCTGHPHLHTLRHRSVGACAPRLLRRGLW